ASLSSAIRGVGRGFDFWRSDMPQRVLLPSWCFRFPGILCLSGGGGSRAIERVVSGSCAGGELARAFTGAVRHAADEPAVGGDAGGALWMVGLSTHTDDGSLYHRMELPSD